MYRAGIVRALERDRAFDVVAVCCDGTEAARAIAELRPDVALLDVQMPGLTGLEVLAQVRAAPELAGTTVVLLSAAEEIGRTALEHGADLGLGKDLTRAQIVEWTWRALQAGRAAGAA